MLRLLRQRTAARMDRLLQMRRSLYLESRDLAVSWLDSMKSQISKEAIPIAVKCDVWYSQIVAAMPKHEKLHIVAENFLAYVVGNEHLTERIHEVTTSNTGVWFHVQFKGNLYGRELIQLLKYVEFSWLEAKEGITSMYINSDDLRNPYLEDDSESS